MRLHASVNQEVRGKDNGAVARYPDAWHAPEDGWALEDFRQLVAVKGCAFSWVFKDSTRSGANFLRSNVLALDFEPQEDSEPLSWEGAQQHEWLQEHAAFLYTSPSHGQEGKGDRFRAVFVLPVMLTDAAGFRLAAKALAHRFSGMVDARTVDAGRLFYGSPDAQVVVFGKQLSTDELQRLLEASPAEAGNTPAVIEDVALGEVRKGGRNNTLTSLTGSMRARGLQQQATLALMQAYNAAYCKPPLSELEVGKLVASVYTRTNGNGTVTGLPATDNGIVQRIVRRTALPRWMYVTGHNVWASWHNGVWRTDDSAKLEVMRLVRDTVLGLAAECDAIDAEGGDSRQLRAAWVRNQPAARIEALMNLLLLEHGWSCKAEELDEFGKLLPVKNGMLNLETLELQPHSPAFRNTVMLEASYNPHATCPRWEAFLEEIFEGDLDLVGFVQRLVGYTLAGGNPAQIFILAHGATGANGKSTFTNVLEQLLGKFLVAQPAAQFLEKRNRNAEGPAENLMRLMGARAVRISELPEDAVLGDDDIKNLTGGDKFVGRRLYGKPVEFTVHAVLWAVGNHRPRIKATDNALWRRVVYIPFEHVVPPERRRPQAEMEAEFRAELDGILLWALEGLQDYRARGLDAPERCLQHVEMYREEQDDVLDFFRERIALQDGSEAIGQKLYDAYQRWWRNKNDGVPERFMMGQRKFYSRLEGQGARKHRDMRGTYFTGIKLLQEVF